MELKEAKNIDIVFLGLAQNCAKNLPTFFNVISKIGKDRNIITYVGENGSDDFTFDVIQKNIFLNNNINFIDTTIIEKFSDRIKRLAFARQKLKDNLINLNISPKLVCVVDLDEVLNENFTPKLIYDLEKTLDKNKEKYFAISLKSEPYYYDILNFESEEYPNKGVKQLQNNRSIKSYNDRKNRIYNLQKSLTKKKAFECVSAFNGLCIYFYDDFIKSNYLENTNDPSPEHLYLNRKINKITGKKILVTENMLRMPTEHKPLNNIVLFLIEKLTKYISIYFKKMKL